MTNNAGLKELSVMTIAILDYGAGNLRSVENALKRYFTMFSSTSTL